jgi:hypothetical protein
MSLLDREGLKELIKKANVAYNELFELCTDLEREYMKKRTVEGSGSEAPKGGGRVL